MKAIFMFELVPDDFGKCTKWVSLVGHNDDMLGEVIQIDADSVEQVLNDMSKKIFPKLLEVDNS